MLRVDSFPRVITLFVNWACNLKCQECWLYGENSEGSLWLGEVKRETVPLELVERLSQEIRERYPAAAVSLMGGEPLMHPRIRDIVRIIKSTCPDVELDMSTNGTLLRRHADAIGEAGIDIVYVSLDGPDPETNDPIRGAGSFRRAMDGLTALSEVRDRRDGPRVGINLTVTGDNYLSLPKLVEHAVAHRVDTLSVNFVMFFGEEVGQQSRKQFEGVTKRPFTSWRGYLGPGQVGEVDRESFERSIATAESTAADLGIELLIAPTRYSARERSTYFSRSWPRQVRERSCPKLYTQTTVLPTGDVLSCTPFSDTVMGNLNNDGSLLEIWEGARYQDFRREFENNLAPICMRCCDLNNDMDQDYAIYEASRA
jgi:radical SAM protein with 4Fe4S-binding SPASM domain